MSSEAQLFGMHVLATLGIDTKNVTGFQIACQVGDVPTIEVRSMLPQGLGEPMAQALSKFRVVPLIEATLSADSPSAGPNAREAPL